MVGSNADTRRLQGILPKHCTTTRALGQHASARLLGPLGAVWRTQMPVTISALAALLALLFPWLGTAANAAEIRLLSAAAMQPVFEDIAPEFERSSGHKLLIIYATVGGVNEKVFSGAQSDFVIGSSLSMPALVEHGMIDGGSLTPICKSGIGVVVATGTVMPHVNSVRAFRLALLAATRIVYADPARGGGAGIHVAKVIELMGLTDQLAPRVRLAAGGDVTEVTLGLGDGAVGITQISEIVGKPGASLLGPLPTKIQNYTVFVGGTPLGVEQSEAVAAFLKFLRGPRSIAAIRAKGMDVE